MADINDFLSKLGIKPSFNMVQDAGISAPKVQPEETENPEDLDPEDMAPAVESDVPQKSQPKLMSDADQAAIQSIPLSASQPASLPQAPVVSEEADRISPAEILKMYRQLKPAQEKRQRELANLGMLQGGNQIAQAIASGYGAKIGDGSEAVNALRKDASQPVSDINDQMNASKDAMANMNMAELSDPKSDVSKFTREQAYGALKKLFPDRDLTGTLDNMSAAQIQKLPGMKNLGAGVNKAVGFGQFIDSRTNEPLYFDQATNTVYNAITKQPVDSSVQIARPIGYTDPVSGGRGYLTNTGMSIPGMKPLEQGQQGSDNKPKDYSYADIAKTAPAQIEKFDKAKEKFNADMKDSREVATAVTNLASKLTPGKNGQVDSGLLGGIQTQAAKMAGQKGVLTDQDLVKFAGAGGVAAKLNRLVDNLQGDMSEDDIKFFKRFSELMGHSLENDIKNRSKLYVDQSRQQLETVAPGITDENVAKLLGVGNVAPVVQKAKPGNPNEVRRKTADGKVAVFDAKTKKFLRYEE